MYGSICVDGRRDNRLRRLAADWGLRRQHRYNRSTRIRVEGDELREKRFNGVFDADDPDSLVRFLESSEGIAVERNGGEVVVRVARRGG